jgi:hypothetical protein
VVVVVSGTVVDVVVDGSVTIGADTGAAWWPVLPAAWDWPRCWVAQ